MEIQLGCLMHASVLGIHVGYLIQASVQSIRAGCVMHASVLGIHVGYLMLAGVFGTQLGCLRRASTVSGILLNSHLLFFFLF